MKKIVYSKFVFFTIAAVVLWLKSYLVYLVEFNLDVENGTQQFLLFLNPLSSMLVFLGIALFAKGRNVGRMILTIYTIMTVFLYANIVFYRFNSDFITLPVLTQTSNFGSIGSSVASLTTWTDMLYFIDVIILFVLYMWSKKEWSLTRLNWKLPVLVMATGVVVFTINLSLAEADRPQLLKRTFDRNYIV